MYQVDVFDLRTRKPSEPMFRNAALVFDSGKGILMPDRRAWLAVPPNFVIVRDQNPNEPRSQYLFCLECDIVAMADLFEQDELAAFSFLLRSDNPRPIMRDRLWSALADDGRVSVETLGDLFDHVNYEFLRSRAGVPGEHAGRSLSEDLSLRLSQPTSPDLPSTSSSPGGKTAQRSPEASFLFQRIASVRLFSSADLWADVLEMPTPDPPAGASPAASAGDGPSSNRAALDAKMMAWTVECLRSMDQFGIAVPLRLECLVVNWLCRGSADRLFQLHQLLQYRVLRDSSQLAALLLDAADSCAAAEQLGLDMLKRIGDFRAIVDYFLRKESQVFLLLDAMVVAYVTLIVCSCSVVWPFGWPDAKPLESNRYSPIATRTRIFPSCCSNSIRPRQTAYVFHRRCRRVLSYLMLEPRYPTNLKADVCLQEFQT